ncbi:MAG: methyltransferase domain-containing protein [Planctomycetota bacterium]|nr:methyltransferase domain-containing protein [Planctomycetota bacterium]
MAKLLWRFAPDLEGPLRAALAQAFQPAERLRTVPGTTGRESVGRAYGLLPEHPGVPVGVFVKVYRTSSLWGLFRSGSRGALGEFINAIRLRELGLPVPRPLALVREQAAGGAWRTYLWMEYVPNARPLADLLRPGAATAEQRRTLANATARLFVDLASHNVLHRDVRPENILVTEDSGHSPAVTLVDLRHTNFRDARVHGALKQMLATLGTFILLKDADPGWVKSMMEAAAEIDRRENLGLVTEPLDDIFAQALAGARGLLARNFAKGRIDQDALDAFARRYATAADAANYRDSRFARSRHGRKVDAAERRIIGDWLRGLTLTGPVLDVPCGTGRLLPILAARAAQTVGADVAPEMIRLARQAAHEAGAACSFIAADARHLPVADDTFELVMAIRLLHRIPGRAERVEVLKELARASRKWILFSFYSRRTWRGLRDRLRGRYGGETRRDIAEEVAEAGMRVDRFVPVGWMARQTLVFCTLNPA